MSIDGKLLNVNNSNSKNNDNLNSNNSSLSRIEKLRTSKFSSVKEKKAFLNYEKMRSLGSSGRELQKMAYTRYKKIKK
ncbi:MAG: hypothetical protein PF488_02705 [Patescibacteria group bacterium]|jgi:hypothetical protein|nr:hypothetical protein [Patescibacteria group bacterium]